jgi:hypothetical protein
MKKHYILNGFESRDSAQRRNHEFALKQGHDENSTTKFMFSVHCLTKEEWGLDVTEDYFHLLDDSEKTPQRLREVPIQPFIQPYIPMVYRYLEKQWTDMFFSEGKLRLSSFRKFRQHTDEQRGDKNEGNNILIGTGKDKTIYTVVTTGIDAFVLSTSLLYNHDLYSDFKVDECFVIERPFEFMQEISKQIPDFKGINFGPCIYKPENLIKRQLPNFDLESLKSEDDPTKIDMNKMFATSDLTGGNDVLFRKTLKHAHQHEYRILWHSDLKDIPDFIDIVAPEARQFCREIKEGELI